MRAVDVHGFGGGFTLGTVQAGFDLIAKKSRGVGFGVLNTLANRHLLGEDWEVQSESPEMWTKETDVDLVFGNPPCSGFSTLSPKHFRGMDSSINDCMWEVANYAGSVAPTMMIFESVQQAYSQGADLMTQLRDRLEELSGHKYDLYHVLHNNAGLGGASIRKRYFMTCIRSGLPFGVEECATRWDFEKNRLEVYEPTDVVTLSELFRDLEPLGLTMEEQSYPSAHRRNEKPLEWKDGEWHGERDGWIEVMNASEWVRQHMHSGTGTVDGHHISWSPTFQRIKDVALNDAGVKWRGGDRISDVLVRIYEKTGSLPKSFDYMSRKPMLDNHGRKMVDDNGKTIMEPVNKIDRLVETDFAMGHNQPVRWRGDRMARVITGGAVHLVVHPNLDRTLTQREAARIQGFPDAWKIWPVRFAPDLGPGWGKGVPVHAGRWVAYWAKESMEGRPGSITGTPVEGKEREYIINVTNAFKSLRTAIGDPG